MIKIPQNTKFSQTNTGDLSGNIHITKNINFDKEGKISLQKRLRSIFDSDTYGDLVTATSEPIRKFVKMVTGSKIWVIGSDSLYYITATTSPYILSLTKDATSGSPTTLTTNMDGCIFQADAGEVFCVTNGSTLYYYNGTAWATVAVTPLSFPTLVCVFENKRSLAVADQNKIALVSSAFSVPAVANLTLPPNYTITAMDWNNDRLYIAAQNVLAEDAMIFEWDGSSAEYDVGYKVESNGVSNLIRYKDGCVAITNAGELLYVNGGTKQLAVFPIFNENKQWISDGNVSSIYRRLVSGGCVVVNDKIYIGVESVYQLEYNDSTSDIFENNFPAGVWCYDPKIGLYHTYSTSASLATRTGAITTANIDTSTNIITIPSSICPDTGTPVFYDDGNKGVGTRATPLENGTRYFVIKLSGTTLKLATTKANALAGTAIDITGTGNNIQNLVFCPNNGFGGIYEDAKGVSELRSFSSFYLPTDTFASELLVGGNVYKNTNAEIVSILSVANGQENRGYFITPRITSSQVKDVWQKMFLKFQPLVNADDKIIIKYRSTKPNRKLRKKYNNSIGGTWVNSTSFTTTEPRFSEVVVGDELEVISGAGAGYLAHITQIALDTGTYTVTIDETIENIATNDAFSFTVDNWIKLKEITATAEGLDGVADISVAKQSQWIQFKVELRGIDIVIEELQLITETFKKSA